jgi:hypothetical protein
LTIPGNYDILPLEVEKRKMIEFDEKTPVVTGYTNFQNKRLARPSTRELLIRLLKAMDAGFLYERDIPNRLGSSRRKEAIAELSVLLSEGYIIRLGTGHRGDPFRIILSGTWPFNKCPLCGHVAFPNTSKE